MFTSGKLAALGSRKWVTAESVAHWYKSMPLRRRARRGDVTELELKLDDLLRRCAIVFQDDAENIAHSHWCDFKRHKMRQCSCGSTKESEYRMSIVAEIEDARQ